MTNQTSNTGPTEGGNIQAPAGSQLPQGDLRCPDCGSTEVERINIYWHCHWCGKIFTPGTGVEPKGAPLPSTSVLVPPVPHDLARRAALAAGELRAVLIEMGATNIRVSFDLVSAKAEGGTNTIVSEPGKKTHE